MIRFFVVRIQTLKLLNFQTFTKKGPKLSREKILFLDLSLDDLNTFAFGSPRQEEMQNASLSHDIDSSSRELGLTNKLIFLFVPFDSSVKHCGTKNRGQVM